VIRALGASLLCVAVATACAHAPMESNGSSPFLDLLVSMLARDWRVLTVEDMLKAAPGFERVDSLEGCEGAVFLQSVEDVGGRVHGKLTFAFEVASTATAGRSDRCVEHLSVLTLSRRSDDVATAVQFAELLADRLKLDFGDSGVVRAALATKGAYAWSVSSESDGSLQRSDLEVRRENEHWLTRFRAFRDQTPSSQKD
jgi:hypothetical protein